MDQRGLKDAQKIPTGLPEFCSIELLQRNICGSRKYKIIVASEKMSTLSRHPCVWRQIAEGCMCLSHQIMLTDSRSTNTLRTHAKCCLTARAGLTGYNKCGLCCILQEMRKTKPTGLSVSRIKSVNSKER